MIIDYALDEGMGRFGGWLCGGEWGGGGGGGVPPMDRP